MKSLWNDKEASVHTDSLAMRVYTSRLLGQDEDLVMHGGGNTSVKAKVKNIFGEEEEILYIKGSGWDLATIEAPGFAPVRLDVLKKMAALKQLTDTDMVKVQRSAMINPSAPSPSVEAIMHAIIPFKFVDHTHADAVVTITNTPGGEEKIKAIYGERILIVPYVMPGFVLARKIYEMTQGIDWSKVEGMVLMNHGVFSFHDDAKTSYENMIKIVTKAEEYIKGQGANESATSESAAKEDFLGLAALRQAVSQIRKKPVIAKLESDSDSVAFSMLPNVRDLATRGTITPDHVIRTKKAPLIVGNKPHEEVLTYEKDYQKYFKKYADETMSVLDGAPRWAVWPGHGRISFGTSLKEAAITSDITRHALRAIQTGEKLGGWKPLNEKDLFEVEYWVLEQAKLGKVKGALPLQGKVALITGAASGIGLASLEALHSQGACVVGLDLNEDVLTLSKKAGCHGIVCDVTDLNAIQEAVKETIARFGGLDILVSNAGIFPPSAKIEEVAQDLWNQSLAVNLSSHERLLQACIPYLSLGWEPCVVIVASKNVPAPGPGASAYSVAKAGLTQLGRVAALELAEKGIRVNVVHPNQVFDTAIWTEDVLKNRALQYGLSVEDYKTNNLLKVEITSKDVAALICSIVGPAFSKTTGAQIPIDGGNDRVI